jgi:4a-hydroxytetrahydrobiopterin dehydratase
MSATRLTGQQINDDTPDGWAYLAGVLHARVRTTTFTAGLALVQAIAEAAEEAGHHPDLDLRYGHVDVRLSSHDVGAVTDRDVRLARTISALAAEAGHEVECADVSRLELGLDTPDQDAVLPFWSAVLGLERPSAPADELRDPFGVLPAVWFQVSGTDEPRQRWHPDVWVDPAQVAPRIEAALAAGGTLVADHGPAFWVLADPEGNRACLCTWQGRG